MKKQEDAFIKIDEIKNTITSALARVGDLEKTFMTLNVKPLN